MTHDEIRTTLVPLAKQPAPQTRDVTASVMADVRRMALKPVDEDRLIWRFAAVFGAAVALAVVIASVTLAPSDNPLAEFAAQSTSTLEIR